MSDIVKSWVRVCTVDSLPKDKPKDININGQRLVIVRCDDRVHVLQGFCSHMFYPLSQGKVNGCELTCALHHSRFDIQDGKVLDWSVYPPLVASMFAAMREKKALRTYETRIVNGEVFVLWPTENPELMRVRI